MKPPIPECEEWRLSILRESKLLNSGLNDSKFDRFTSLAQRILNAPMAFVTFVDVDHVWFKSICGKTELTELRRDEFFCAYTILPDQPDVFVVEDASKDDRFKDLKVVTDEPKIRFYAGAAIMLDQVKIGSLCVLDTAPKTSAQFTTADRMNLLDLGAAVSVLLKDTVASIANTSMDGFTVLANIMHDMQKPLTALQTISSRVGAVQQPGGKGQAESLRQITGHFQVLIDSGSSLGELAGQFAKPKDATVNYRRSSILATNFREVIRDTREALALMQHHDNQKVSWNIDPQINRNIFHRWNHQAIRFILLNGAENLLTTWNEICVNISLAIETAGSGMSTDPQGFTGDGLQGCALVIELAAAKGGGAEAEESLDDMNNRFHLLQNVIENLRGSCSIAFEEIPCRSVKTAPLALEMGLSCVNPRRCFVLRCKLPCAVDPRIKLRPEDASGSLSSTQTIQTTSVPAQALVNETTGVPAKVNGTADLQLGFSAHPAVAIADRSTKGSSSKDLTRPETPLSTLKLKWKSSPIYSPVSLSARGKAMTSLHEPLTGSSPPSASKSRKAHKATFALQDASKVAEEVEGRDGVPEMVKHRSTSFMGDWLPISRQASQMQMRLRVLVCEDSASAQKMMVRWLEKSGCDVTVANNGREGLQYMTTHDFDICFMDFLMPVMNGIDAISGFKNWVSEVTGGRCYQSDFPYLNKEMLIIGMSAGTLNDDMAGAFLKGMHYFLPKPVQREQLQAIVKIKKTASSLEEVREKLDDLSGKDKEEDESPGDARRSKPQSQAHTPTQSSVGWDPSWRLLNPASFLKRTFSSRPHSGAGTPLSQH